MLPDGAKVLETGAFKRRKYTTLQLTINGYAVGAVMYPPCKDGAVYDEDNPDDDYDPDHGGLGVGVEERWTSHACPSRSSKNRTEGLDTLTISL